jgi:hypothetical protein
MIFRMRSRVSMRAARGLRTRRPLYRVPDASWRPYQIRRHHEARFQLVRRAVFRFRVTSTTGSEE